MFHEIGIDHFNPSEEDIEKIRMFKNMEQQLIAHKEEKQRKEEDGPFGIKRLANVVQNFELDEDMIWNGLLGSGDPAKRTVTDTYSYKGT